MRQADPNGLLTNKYDLSSLRATFVAGERSDPSTLHWIEDILKEYDIPAIDHWWQTELAFPGAGNALGLGKITTRYGAVSILFVFSFLGTIEKSKVDTRYIRMMTNFPFSAQQQSLATIFAHSTTMETRSLPPNWDRSPSSCRSHPEPSQHSTTTTTDT